MEAPIGEIVVEELVDVEPDVVAAFESALRLGTVTALVNNAGIVAPRSRVEDITLARLDGLFGVNAIGAFLWLERQSAGCRRGTAAAAAPS